MAEKLGLVNTSTQEAEAGGLRTAWDRVRLVLLSPTLATHTMCVCVWGGRRRETKKEIAREWGGGEREGGRQTGNQ